MARMVSGPPTLIRPPKLAKGATGGWAASHLQFKESTIKHSAAKITIRKPELALLPHPERQRGKRGTALPTLARPRMPSAGRNRLAQQLDLLGSSPPGKAVTPLEISAGIWRNGTARAAANASRAPRTYPPLNRGVSCNMNMISTTIAAAINNAKTRFSRIR